MNSTKTASIYQALLGAEFAQLGPVLQHVHGGAAVVHAQGFVTVTHGKGWLVRLCNRMMDVPPAGENVPLKLEVQRRPDHESWIRSFGGKVLRTEQWAKDGLFVEAVGPIQMFMRLRWDSGILRFEPVLTRCFGIKVPSWVRVNVKADVEELADGWRILVETSSALLGLMFRYTGTIALVQ